MKILFLLVAMMFFVGCAPVIVTPYNTFDEVVHKTQMEPGTSKIEGQGFLRTVGGDVKYAAGSKVLLLPATDYVMECSRLNGPLTPEQLWTGRQVNCDPRMANAARITQADGEGRFKFENVKIGKYYVETHVTWSAGNYNTQGGSISITVEVTKDGETVSAIVTQ